MRERAVKATPGPWWHRENIDPWSVRPPDTGEWRPEVADVGDPRDAAHIASWHPAVALAVADWLDNTAAWWTRTAPGEPPPDPSVLEALAVARAYLGDQP
jgi:hypothetical protein